MVPIFFFRTSFALADAADVTGKLLLDTFFRTNFLTVLVVAAVVAVAAVAAVASLLATELATELATSAFGNALFVTFFFPAGVWPVRKAATGR